MAITDNEQQNQTETRDQGGNEPMPTQLSIQQRVEEARKQRREQFKSQISDEQVQASTEAGMRWLDAVASGKGRNNEGILEGIGAGIVRAPAAALGGTLDFANDAGGLVGNYINDKFYRGEGSPTARAIVNWTRNSPVGEAWSRYSGSSFGERTDFYGQLSGENNGFSQIGNDAANDFTTQVGAVVAAISTMRPTSISFGQSIRNTTGVGRVFAEGTNAARAAGFAGAALQGVVSEAVVLDPDEERLGNLARDYFGWEGALVDFLALDEDDSVFERRLSQAAEGALTGVAFEGVLAGFKWARAAARGDKAAAEQIGKEQTRRMAEEAGISEEELVGSAQPEYVIEPEQVQPNQVAPDDNDIVAEAANSRLSGAFAQRRQRLSDLTEQLTRAERRLSENPDDPLGAAWKDQLEKRLEGLGIDPTDLPDELSGVRKSVIEAMDKEGQRLSQPIAPEDRFFVQSSIADQLANLAQEGPAGATGADGQTIARTTQLLSAIYETIASETGENLRAVFERWAPKVSHGTDASMARPGGKSAAGTFEISYSGRGSDQQMNFPNGIIRMKAGYGTDPRVILHEHAHWYLDLTERAFRSTDGPEFLKKQYQEIADWLGHDVNAPLINTTRGGPNKGARAFHEKFAENFEHYLKTGKAPTPALQNAFDVIKEFMVRARNLFSNGEFKDPRARAIYDRMLAGTEASPFADTPAARSTEGGGTQAASPASARPAGEAPGPSESSPTSPTAPSSSGAGAEGAPDAAGGRASFDTQAFRGTRPIQEGASEGGVRAASMRREQLAADAQNAATQAGLPADTFSARNIKVTGSGRIVVTGEQYAALDRIGLGDAFIKAADVIDSGDQVLIKETVNGTTRVLGSMSRSDLAQLQADVRVSMGQSVENYQQVNFRNTGQLTLTFGDPGKLQGLLRGIVASLPDNAKRVRNDADLALGARTLANQMGIDETAARAWAQQLAGVGETLDVHYKALETVFTRSVKALEGLIDKDFSQMPDLEFKAAAAQVHNALTLAYQVTRIKSGLGRALRTRQLPDADTYIKAVGGDRAAQEAAAAARKANDNMPVIPITRDEMQRWVEDFKEAEMDPKSLMPWLQDHVQLPTTKNLKYLRTSFANFFTASILSGARTISLNVVAPSILGAYRTAEKSMGSLVRAVAGTTVDEATGKLRPISLAERRQAIANSAEAWKSYTYAAAQIPQAFKYALASAKRGKGRLGSGTGLQDIRNELYANAQDAANVSRGDRIQYGLGNLINIWPRAFGRLAIGLDEFSNFVSYSGEVAWKATDEADLKGLKGAQRDQFIRSKLEESVNTFGQATDQEALREGQRTTLTSRIRGSDGPGYQIAGSVNSWRREIPELRYILPVWNIPMNGLGETLRRIPVVAPLYEQTWKELKGQAGPAAQADAYGRMMLSAGLTLWAFNQARAGLLTGPGPTDPEARKQWLLENQPYSIKTPWGWVEYGKFDVVGSLMSVPATLYDQTIYRDYGNENQNVFLAGIGAMTDFLRNRAALDQASQFLSMTSGDAEWKLENFLERLPSSFIPAGLRDMRNMQAQGLINDKATFGDYVMDSLPFAYRTLTPKRDIFGRPVHGPRDTIAENLLPISIKPATHSDPTTSEVVRIAAVTGSAVGIPNSSSVYGGGNFDPKNIKLEDGATMIERFVDARGRAVVDGKTLHQAVTDLINSEEYKRALDADASNLTLEDGRQSKAALLSRVFSRYNKAGRTQLARESEMAARYMAFGRIRSSGSLAVEQFRASDVVDDPTLLRQVGIDLDQYVIELQQGE